ncbi:MAG: methionine--tRNA ligase [Anaerolineales bacterium]
MAENILVAVAWPYANADIHVGNIAGAYLPADIFARYHRLRGNRVLMVSGTDAHGTPITVRADSEGRSPEEVYHRFHDRFLELFLRAGLSYDLFTTTHNPNHFRVSQDFFLGLQHNGYLETRTEDQWFSPSEGRFLPDRYVEGECYICHYPSARGDQCDNCGNLLDATQLIRPHARTGGGALELRPTEHFFLDLARLAPELKLYFATGKNHWRPSVLNPSRHSVTQEVLPARAITRDLDWGIPVPVEGWQGKRIYVWFEAVIGYFSASIEWAKRQGNPQAWKDWWYDPAAKTYYFIGKDNIIFHAIFWPAELIGVKRLYEDDPSRTLNLPYDVPANEFLNLEKQKISGSRNWAVWGLDFLDRYDPDPLRFYLTSVMPETRDSEWDWADFVRRNNDELVGTWGNLAHRVLSFAHRHWEGCVPEPGELGPADRALLESILAGYDSVGSLIEAVNLRGALAEALSLARQVNGYLDRAPWFSAIRTDREAAARTVYTALQAIDHLNVIFAPFLPFTAERLHQALGYSAPLFGESRVVQFAEDEGGHKALIYDPSVATGKWQPGHLPPGQALRTPEPLYRKLDDSVVEVERARLGTAP